MQLGFKQCSPNPCIFFYNKVTLLTYVDKFILIGPNNENIEGAIEMMRENADDVQEKGDLCHLVGVHVKELDDGTIILYQPHLIESILTDAHLLGGTRPASVLMVCSVVFYTDLEGEPF